MMTVDTVVKVYESEKFELNLCSSEMNVVGGDVNGECNGECKVDSVFIENGDVVLSDCNLKYHEGEEVNVGELSLEEGCENNVYGNGINGEDDDVEIKLEILEVENGHVKNHECEEVKEGGDDNGVNGEIKTRSEIVEVGNDDSDSYVEGEVDVDTSVSVVKEGSDQERNVDEVEGSGLQLVVDEAKDGSDRKLLVEKVKEVEFGFKNSDNVNVSLDDIGSRSLDVDDNGKESVSDGQESDQVRTECITTLDSAPSVPEPSEAKDAEFGVENSDNSKDFFFSNVDENSKNSCCDTRESAEGVSEDITAVSSVHVAPEPSANINTATVEVPEGELETEKLSVTPLEGKTVTQGSETERLEDGGRKAESKIADTLSMESKPLETGVADQSVENGFTEPRPLDDNVKASLRLNSKGGTEKPNFIEIEAKIDEQGDFDLLEAGESQELGEPETARFETDQGEITDQSGPDLTVEAEARDSQSLPNNPEGEQNQCNLKSPWTEKPHPIRNGQSHGSKIDSTFRAEENSDALKSSVESEPERVDYGDIEDGVMQEQIAGHTGSFDVVCDKELSSEDCSTEKNRLVEDGTNLSKNDTGGSQVRDDAPENKVVPPSDEFSEDVHCDSNIVDEQGVVDDVSLVADNSVSDSIDDTGSQTKLENRNCPMTHPAHDTKSGTKSLNSEIDVVVKSNDVLNGNLRHNISFGSFESDLPFSHNDTSINLRTAALNKSTALSTTLSESKFCSPNNVVSLDSQANGDHTSELNVDTSHVRVARSEQINAVSASPVEGSESGFSDAQNINPDFVRKPFYWLVMIPRGDEEKYRELLRESEIELAEKTRTRHAYQAEFNKHLAYYRELKSNLEASKLEAKAASDSLKAKWRELDSAQYLINLAKSLTVEDVDNQIQHLEHTLQHESHTLRVERELVRQIRELNQQRQQLLADPQRQLEVQHALNQRDQTQEQLKVLRKERDTLRDNLSKADEQVRAAQKKHDDESVLLNHWKQQLISASDNNQQAYVRVMTLKKQLNEKISPYYKAKNDLWVAYKYAAAGQKDILERHCLNQVEKVMEMWNKNDEFRKEYIKCNMSHMLKKFGTLDGTDLGINEVPPFLGEFSGNGVYTSVKVNSSISASTGQSNPPVEGKVTEDQMSKKVEQKKAPPLKKKDVMPKKSSAKSSRRIVIEEYEDEPKLLKEEEESARKEVISETSLAKSSRGIEIGDNEKEPKPTKEEEELSRKEEQSRREEEAARLREQRRLEEKAKAQEALERKRRNEAKARARAEFKAQKEAEEKEKEREKREMKKQKKRGLNAENAEYETGQSSQPSSESVREPEVAEKPATVTKRPQKASLHTKPIKTTEPIPLALRKKGKKGLLQYWPYACILLLAIALFYLGNYETIQTIEQHISGILHR